MARPRGWANGRQDSAPPQSESALTQYRMVVTRIAAGSPFFLLGWVPYRPGDPAWCRPCRTDALSGFEVALQREGDFSACARDAKIAEAAIATASWAAFRGSA